MKKADFLDRDGTLNKDFGYVHTIENFEWIGGAKDSLLYFKELGYLLVVISNQSGLARGYFSESDILRLHRSIQQDLRLSHQVEIDAYYYCSHHPEGVVEKYKKFCDCRKPASGMFRKAILEWEIDPVQSIVIGDKEKDLIPARDVGISSLFLFDSNERIRQTVSWFSRINSWQELIDSYQITF